MLMLGLEGGAHQTMLMRGKRKAGQENHPSSLRNYKKRVAFLAILKYQPDSRRANPSRKRLGLKCCQRARRSANGKKASLRQTTIARPIGLQNYIANENRGMEMTPGKQQTLIQEIGRAHV